jgi:NADH:ubiquinone oxidoreductase subunit 5 (subunit L)/multisubunit Na+/H+ antiporter MnhA subunit
MADTVNPVATHHLPSFITAPGETDVLMVVMVIVLAISVLAFGVLFLRLHTLPERMAHRTHKLQFEIVAVLGLIALFTHMHIFWIAGLLLALIDFPDFGSVLGRIAGAVEKIAGVKRDDSETAVIAHSVEGAEVTSESKRESRRNDGDGGPAQTGSGRISGSQKELDHA